MNAFKQNLATLAANISPALLKELGAKNIKPVSHRTVQFDCPPRADGTNRIKVTIEGGEFMVRGFKIEETDVIYGIEPGSVATALKAIGSELPNVPTKF